VIRFHRAGLMIHAPTAALIYQFPRSAGGAAPPRVAELEQPVFCVEVGRSLRATGFARMRGPMTGSAKQSIPPQKERIQWNCFVAEFIIGPAKGGNPLAPRNDGKVAVAGCFRTTMQPKKKQ